MDRTGAHRSEMQAILAGLRSLDRHQRRPALCSADGEAVRRDGWACARQPHMLIDLSSWYKTSLPPKIEPHPGGHRAAPYYPLYLFLAQRGIGANRRALLPGVPLVRLVCVGLVQMRKDFRLFKLNRMTGLTSGELFEPRPAPLPDLEPERVFPVKYQVTVLFDPTCRWRLVEEYGADRFTVAPDGRLRFTGGFQTPTGVLSWVLTFGDKAELLEPEELRERLGVWSQTLTADRYRGRISMASHPDFVNYVAEQLREAGAIRSRKMFGEYGLYCDDVFFAVICDDQFFVKGPRGAKRRSRPAQGSAL